MERLKKTWSNQFPNNFEMFEPSQKAMFHFFGEPSQDFSKMPLIQFQNLFPLLEVKIGVEDFPGSPPGG